MGLGQRQNLIKIHGSSSIRDHPKSPFALRRLPKSQRGSPKSAPRAALPVSASVPCSASHSGTVAPPLRHTRTTALSHLGTESFELHSANRRPQKSPNFLRTGHYRAGASGCRLGFGAVWVQWWLRAKAEGGVPAVEIWTLPEQKPSKHAQHPPALASDGI